MPPQDGRAIFTIGHSTREIKDFLEVLEAHDIGTVADVRSIPMSGRHPQFNHKALAESLAAAGIAYRHFPALGGRRRPRPDSANTGWRNASFRAYADHMETTEFAVGLEALMEEARERRTAIMCAEAVPWRCHRKLIGDALAMKDWQVSDIMDRGAAKPHVMTPFLEILDGRLVYAEDGQGRLDM